MIGPRDLINRFAYAAPTAHEAEVFKTFRDAAFNLALYIDENCSDSRAKEEAVTKIEEAVMWGHAALARNKE